MKVKDRHFETIWIHPDNSAIVQIIDQRFLPFRFIIEDIHSAEEMYVAIKDMHLRGAPLIGAAGALGVYLALTGCNEEVISKSYIAEKATYLKSSRPTAINLNWAVDRVLDALGEGGFRKELIEIARRVCLGIIDEERNNCLKIGEYGL